MFSESESQKSASTCKDGNAGVDPGTQKIQPVKREDRKTAIRQAQWQEATRNASSTRGKLNMLNSPEHNAEAQLMTTESQLRRLPLCIHSSHFRMGRILCATSRQLFGLRLHWCVSNSSNMQQRCSRLSDALGASFSEQPTLPTVHPAKTSRASGRGETHQPPSRFIFVKATTRLRP